MRIKYSKVIDTTENYVFSEINKKVDVLKQEGITVIDFGVGSPKNSPPIYVINSLSRFAKDKANAGYPSYIGDKNYRNTCAYYIKREYNVDLDPDTEIASNIGSKEAIFNFPIGFADLGDTVICPTPAFPAYKIGTKFRNAKVYFVPLLEENNFLIDFSAIPESVAKEASIIWINYPNSPTGVSATKQWLESLTSWATHYNIIIAADEGCYNDIYFTKKPTSILEVQKKGVITFYSLSKRSNMATYRVGFVAGDKRLISGFKKVKTNIDSGTPTFIQDVACLALNDRVEIAKLREEYRIKREIMINALAFCGLDSIKGDSTFYLWQKIPQYFDSIQFSMLLMELGIIVMPGQLLSDEVNGINPGSRFVRFALVPTLEEIKAVARKIKGNLKNIIRRNRL